MNAIKVAVAAFVLASIASTGYAFSILGNLESNAKSTEDSRVILGHRIGSNGQEILVYAEERP